MRRVSSCATALALAIALGLAALGCQSPEEKLAGHYAKADDLVRAGKAKEALFELRAALKLDPKRPETNFRLAQLLHDLRQFNDAVFYYRETVRLEPSRTDAMLAEAGLLIFDEPTRAEELIAKALELEPDNVRAYAARSQLELALNDSAGAFQAALTAVELAPESFEAQRQLAMVHQARIREAQLAGEEPPDSVYEEAIAAFDRAQALLGDEPSANLRVNRAAIYAAWAGHQDEAIAQYRLAVDEARRSSDKEELRLALRQTQLYARDVRNIPLMRETLEELVRLDPQSTGAWQQLAWIAESQQRQGEAVMQRMLAARPDDPEAHVAYALFLVRSGRTDDGLAHLKKRAEGGNAAPELQGALVNLYYGLQRSKDAALLTAELERTHPEHPRTALARAQQAMFEGRHEDAAKLLRETAGQAESADVFRLLAGAELRLGRLGPALDAIGRSIELEEASNSFPEEAYRLRAQIQVRMNDCRGAIRSFGPLSRGNRELAPHERVMQAHCLYEIGQEALGRKLLEQVLAQGPTLAAVLEFAEREKGRQPEKVRALLEQSLAQSPGDPTLLNRMARFELETGRPEQALARMNEAVAAGGGTPRLLLDRARLLVGRGDLEAAERDALRAFQGDPELPGAAPFLVQLYRAQGKLEEAVASFEEAHSAGALDPNGRVLLARMYIVTGQDAKARALLESTLAERNDLPGAKNDLAYLLASAEQDLDRALRLAQEAQQGLPNSPDVADTVGFVYLRKGLLTPAVEQFRYALELARARDAEQPIYHYHLGLALRGQELTNEAEAAFERALALDAGFEDAKSALSSLRAARDEAAANNPS
jgi:tetratricopeptide (TPR) repeat protein